MVLKTHYQVWDPQARNLDLSQMLNYMSAEDLREITWSIDEYGHSVTSFLALAEHGAKIRALLAQAQLYNAETGRLFYQTEESVSLLPRIRRNWCPVL